MFDHYLIPQETSFKKIRVGNNGDGGYVIADNDVQGYTGIVGLGINDDNSFEQEFQKLSNCVVQEYDYSIDAPPTKIPKSTFYKTMVQDQSDIVNIESLGDRKFLKMDIEGSEWDLLKTLDLEQFEQIACEFHFNKIKNFEILDKISSTHNMIHVHGNSCDPSINAYTTKNNKIAIMPATMEFTFLRKDQGNFYPNKTWYPTDLDVSCDTRPDWDLRMYPFAPLN